MYGAGASLREGIGDDADWAEVMDPCDTNVDTRLNCYDTFL